MSIRAKINEKESGKMIEKKSIKLWVGFLKNKQKAINH
jgi:hypothetical protein